MSHFLKFSKISNKQMSSTLVGGKAAALARLYQEKFPVPEGFVITTNFFDHSLKENSDIIFSNESTEIIRQLIDECSLAGS